MKESYDTLNVEEIDFDIDNPRIKMALEKYGDRLNAERIYFALRTATDGEQKTSSFSSLKDSIHANKGITQPITVVLVGDKKICIDGNSRLAIYKDFLKQEIPGDWSRIKALVIEGASQRDIETIRVSAHLVGVREWPAYEKARYLDYLRNQEFMEYEEIIALCGGDRNKIERQIDAYRDMNEYYRDIVDDTAFRIDRFSGFVELQKQNVKDAIFQAGFELTDFGEWIRDGKIHRLADVRHLPKVLHDDEARETFLNGGLRSIEDAIKLLDRKNPKFATATLENATIYQIADILARRINDLPYSEVRSLREKEHEDVIENINSLEDLSIRLENLLEDVSE
ncbi:MAG: hypothetical protein OXG10_06850 [Candidatus Dadabacteria bacterium]|nr:hypothetical protein [Candidatus Dadabacteria bacterium]